MSLQVSIDDRSNAEKLTRRMALDICEKRGFPVPNENIPLGTGIPLQDKGPTILKWMETHGIDPNDAFPELEWQTIRGKDERGNEVSTNVPVRPLHESATLSINYDKEIERRAKAHEDEIEAKNEEISELKAMVENLVSRVESMGQAIPMSRATIPQLRKLAKDKGLDVKTLKTKQDLLDALGE